MSSPPPGPPARPDAKYSVRSSSEKRGVSSATPLMLNGSLCGAVHAAAGDERAMYQRSFVVPAAGSMTAKISSFVVEDRETSSSPAGVAAPGIGAGVPHGPNAASSGALSSENRSNPNRQP